MSHLIPKFKNNMPAVMPPVWDRFSKEELEEIIIKNYGIITVICSLVDCNYKQLYQALDKYNLRNTLAESKQQLVSIAEQVVMDCLKSESEKIRLDTAKYTLNSLGKNQGW